MFVFCFKSCYKCKLLGVKPTKHCPEFVILTIKSRIYDKQERRFDSKLDVQNTNCDIVQKSAERLPKPQLLAETVNYICINFQTDFRKRPINCLPPLALQQAVQPS